MPIRPVTVPANKRRIVIAGLSGLFKKLKGLVDRYPTLQKPAYRAFSGAMAAKNWVYSGAYRVFSYVPKRMSDRGQDRWVIEEVFPGKRNGFFVELGAYDGFSESNTFVLEKHFDWHGICIEPSPLNFHKLTKVRNCTCVPLAVDPVPGKLEFVLEGQRSGLILDEADNSPERRSAEIEQARNEGRVQTVESVPFDQLLDRYGAPRKIDYLSLDVEGSETRIMRDFPFDKYQFLSMTIERPTPELNELLFANGYHFVRNSLYDTFYIHESNPNFSKIRREPFEQLPEKTF